MATVLVADDDAALQELLREILSGAGYGVEVVRDGAECLAKAGERRFDLILLDVMMPRMDGFETLRRLRQMGPIPVIMLTARGQEPDRIMGLEGGADDYLPKPFNARELLARMQSVLRRARGAVTAAGATVQRGDISLDRAARVVRRGEERIDLTTAEFDLLRELLEKPGVALSRDHLCRAVLGREYQVFDRAIDNLVSSLRKKLGPTAEGFERIKTLRSQGYSYVDLAN